MNTSTNHIGIPQTWDGIYGHERITKRLKRKLATNNWKVPGIFITGPSGCGKNSIVNVFLKALFCKNRKPGEVDPCGYCPSCQTDPRLKGLHNNILWIQKGKSQDSIADQFNVALGEMQTPPYGNPLDDLRYYKVIVIDEVWGILANQLSKLLFATDGINELFEMNRTIWILMTMSEDEMQARNPELYKALITRLDHLRLMPFQPSHIYNYLATDRFSQLTPSSRKMIAKYAKGSLRAAIRAYEKVTEELNDQDEISDDDVAELLYFITDEKRKQFWYTFQKANVYNRASVDEVWTLYESIIKVVDPSDFLLDLIEDVTVSIRQGYTTDRQLQFLNLAHLHYAYRYSHGQWQLLNSFLGESLVSFDIFDHSSSPSLFSFPTPTT